MPKHPFRSFFGSRIGPEKDEELKLAETEVEGNVQKTLQALEDDNNDGKGVLVNWIEDFDKHDQSLYERYVRLTEELRKKADGKHGKDSSSSSSDSDERERLHREYETAWSKAQEAQNMIRELNSEAEKWNDGISGLRTDNAGVGTELRKKADGKHGKDSSSSSDADEKERLHGGYETAAWSKAQEAQNTIRELNSEAEKWNEEISGFWTENAGEKERGSLTLSISQLEDKLEISAKVISEPCEMQEQKTSLSSKISQLEDDKKQAENIPILETELGQLGEKLEDKEIRLLNQMELASLVGQKRESQIQLEKQEQSNTISEINRSKEEKNTLLERFKGLERDLNSMPNQILGLEEQLKDKRQELLKSLYRSKTLRKELEKRTAEHQEIPEDKKKLDLQVQGFYQEINALWNKKNEVEEELQNKTAERQKILEDNIKLDFQIERLYLEIKAILIQKPEAEEKLNEHKKILEDEQNLHLEMSSVRNQKYEVQLGTVGKNEKLKEELSVRVGNAIMDQLEDATKEEVVSFLKQMELLQTERCQPGTHIERSKQESEDLKREISTLSNNLRYVESVQRLTTQKLRTTEELLSQKEEEQKVVEDTLKGMMFAYDEAQVLVSAEVDDMMTEINAFYVEVEESFGLLKSRVNEIANKIKMRKDSDVLRSNIKDMVKKIRGGRR